MVKNTKEYLVLVSDVVAKHITIKAKSEKEAAEKEKAENDAREVI